VVTQDLVGHRAPVMTALARSLTFVGSEVVVGSVALLLLAMLLRRRSWDRALTVACGIAGSAALTVAVKLLVGRARPPAVDRLGPIDHTYSFPSGHTLNSSVLLGLLVLVVAPTLAAARRRALGAAAVALALGVGVSRAYLGYHWATDVMAGWLLAVAWLSTVVLLVPAVRRGR
jgi:undecaprenyl-diphosphatase